jgi:hypothetical protein
VPGLPRRLELARNAVLARTRGFVLELGGGRGVLAEALMGEVDQYLGIDRSPHAVDAGRSRLAALERSTRWSLHLGTLDTAAVPRSAVDVAVAVNVNVFWTSPARRELDRLTELLEPEGSLVLVYEAPGGAGDRLLGPLARSLDDAGYAWDPTRSGEIVVVVASPGKR